MRLNDLRPLLLFSALVLVATAVFFLPAWAAQSDGSKNQDGHLLLGADMSDRRRPPVSFDHESHAEEFDCLDCHHVFVDGENVLDPLDLETGDAQAACSACHNGSPDERMRAFHAQCATCHEGRETAPKSCNGCHGP